MALRASRWDWLNADVSWAAFDPIAYIDHNYLYLQAGDAEILSLIRDHFSGHCPRDRGRSIAGIDVGAGANLYPALAMLPWCDEIALFERSPANVRYLKSQVKSYADNWDQFWRVLCKNEAYGALDMDPRARFRGVVHVEEGNLFDLMLHQGRWSMGTMFFVAESMTSSREEFDLGVECFLRALAPGAPFAAAFMEHSHGYQTGDHSFPACDVGMFEVELSLKRFADDVKTERIESQTRVRDGYFAMIVAYGRRNSDGDIPQSDRDR
ncbi:SCO2525 family SAM-dependent methyltransferase [Streptomyces sp. NPDC048002]|uniref:SCO2525 family SAM-dependent methyltransferase n=1 Tax=Streptomyces sp. NPDC048002 TaxID=3154344 RepID=UPI0033FD9117